MGRPMYCDLHHGIFRNSGITVVLRKIVFNFCARCWRLNKEGCEAHAVRVAGGTQ